MEQERQNEIRGLFQILEQTAEIAEDAILTETYKDSESRCISQFNKVLQRLDEMNVVPKDLFDPLQEDAAFSEISIACNHLAAYLSEGLGTLSDLKGMMTNILGKKFIDDVSEDLKEGKIGVLIRKSMPQFLTEATLDDIKESFNVGEAGQLTLVTELGNIDIQTSQSNTIDVTVRRSAQLKADKHAVDILKDFDINFDQQDKNLHIDAKFKGSKRYWEKITGRFEVHFEIGVPQRYDVNMQTENGDISVANVEGKVNAKTISGELQLENITGPVIGYTSKGNAKLIGCKGDVYLQTTQGNIEVNEHIGTINTMTSKGHLLHTNVLGNISGQTANGNIKLSHCKGGAEVETTDGNIELETDGTVAAKTAEGFIDAKISGQLQKDSVLGATGGNITVSLIPEIDVKIDAKSSDGKITTEFPVTVVVQGSLKIGQLQGDINDSGPLLTLRCVGGDINLKRSNIDDKTS